jgi:SAM-dependent methyltransferase
MSAFQGPAGNNFNKFEATGAQGRMVDEFNARVVEALHNIPGVRVLDAGCGEGQMIHHIVERNSDLVAVGIDADAPELKAYWERFEGPRLRFQVADVCALPFEDNSFDIVTALEVLEHLENPHLALREIRRVCRGTLIATVPWEPIWRVGNMAQRRYFMHLGNTPGHIQHWTRRGFGRLLAPHGRIEHLERCAVWSLAQVRLSDRNELSAPPIDPWPDQRMPA